MNHSFSQPQSKQKIDRAYSPLSLSIYGNTILFYTIVYMVLMVLPLYAKEELASYTLIGWVMGVTMLASMVSRPFAGYLIDRFGASLIFISASFLFALSLTGYFIHSFFAYWIVRLIQGIVAACFSTAMEVITIHLLSDRLRAQGLSLYSLATVIPTTFAPAVTLFLQHIVSVRVIFLLLFSLGMLNLYFALHLFKHLRSFDILTKEKIRGQVYIFISNLRLLFPTLIMFLVSIANGAIFTFLPLYLQTLSSSFASIYFLLQMMTLVVTRFIGARFLPSNGSLPISVVMSLLIFLAACLFLIYYHPSSLILSFAAIFSGLSFALLYPLLLTFVSFHIASQYKGYYLGLFIGGADFGFAMGAIAGGVIADVWSLAMIFLCCTLFTLLALLLLFIGSKIADLKCKEVNYHDKSTDAFCT